MKIKLRPYQEPAAQALLKVIRGIVKAPGGSGKTWIAGRALALARKKRCDEIGNPGQVLWLAYTTDQLNQGAEACELLGAGPVDFRCYASGVSAVGYGFVICDECHHVAAPEFSKIFDGFIGGVVWGFSATPDREDELKAKVYEICGPIVFEVPREECNLAKAKVFFHTPNKLDEFTGSIDELAKVEAKKMDRYAVSVAVGMSLSEMSRFLNGRQRLELLEIAHRNMAFGNCYLRELKAMLVTPADKEKVNALGLVAARGELYLRAQWHSCQGIGIFENESRNCKAIELANKHVLDMDSVLVLVGSIEHGAFLLKYIAGSTLVYSKLGKKKREAAIEDFRSGKLKCMIATSLADEGLDVPRANVLILASAGRSKSKAEQRTARVLREFAEKTHGTIHDFWDQQYPMLLNQSRARKRVYESLDYEIQNLGSSTTTDEAKAPLIGDGQRAVDQVERALPVPMLAEPNRRNEGNSSSREPLNPNRMGEAQESIDNEPPQLSGDLAAGKTFSQKEADTTCEVASTVRKSYASAPDGVEAPPVNTEPAKPAHSEREHAKLSPSTLKARAICPGFFSDPFGDKTASNRGTLGHKSVEEENPDLCGEDKQLREAVEMCIEYKRKVASTYAPGFQMFQEIKLPYFDQWGFCDVLMVQDACADLIDWKFAYNEYEADSPQFWAYCIGVWDLFPAVSQITVRVPHPFLAAVDVEPFTREKHYNQFRINVLAIFAAQAANDPTKFRITEQCSFCGFARKCSKMAAFGLEIGRRYAPELELPEGTLHGSEVTDPKTMAALLKIARPVKKAAEGWGKYGLEMYDKGTEIPGFRLMSKKGNRSIASTRKAYEIIKAHFDPTMTAEKFLDLCEVSATSLDKVVEDLAPPRGKKEARELLEAHLEDDNAINHGGSGRFLKATKVDAEAPEE